MDKPRCVQRTVSVRADQDEVIHARSIDEARPYSAVLRDLIAAGLEDWTAKTYRDGEPEEEWHKQMPPWPQPDPGPDR